jgi:hypothetical protein
VLHWSDRWHALVRPVTLVRLVDRVGQAGGYNSCTTHVPKSLRDFSRPWNKNTPKNTTCTKGKPYTKPSKTIPNRPRTDQQHHDPKTHESSSSPEANPTSGIHRSDRSSLAARDEQHPRVNSPKSNSRSPESPHADLHKTLGIVGTPHEESIAKFMPTKSCQIKKNRRNPTKNSSNPRTPKTPKSFPLTHGFGRESKAEEPRRVHTYFPHQIPKSKVPKTHQENHQQRALKITTKNNQ